MRKRFNEELIASNLHRKSIERCHRRLYTAIVTLWGGDCFGYLVLPLLQTIRVNFTIACCLSHLLLVLLLVQFLYCCCCRSWSYTMSRLQYTGELKLIENPLQT